MSMTMMPLASSRPPRYRWTGEEFDQVTDTGVFDGRHLELINGDLLESPPTNDPHAQAVQLGTHALIRSFAAIPIALRVQLPMRLGDSRPLPDLVVAAGSPRDVVTHPTTAILVIEVSDSTLEFDRTEKAILYATNGVTDYWIMNLVDKCVEVYRDILADSSGNRRYGNPRIHRVGSIIYPLALPDTPISVNDLLP